MPKVKALFPKLTGRGGYGCRIRFFDEQRGERFFDTEFSVWQPEPGSFTLGPVIGYRGYLQHDGLKAKDTIGQVIKVGSQFHVQPIKHCQIGQPKYLVGQTITVTSIEFTESGSVKIFY